ERPGPAADLDDLFILPDIQPEVLDHPAIVLERLPPGRLVLFTDEREPAQLQRLGRAEERHVRGVVRDPRGYAPLVEEHRVHARLARRDPDAEAAGPGADHRQLDSLRHFNSIDRVTT